ncbi:hypothetical protein PACTADRAFT_42973 [Pachysolen tannophilus NRRL Y-2460]|uniref:MI domain-containing protein n=1 Tax=Pachysolen tannophilus NRRL Y-2460 TaxID=669874 RepID=A0A1E4TU12_PACTA|nr:hypothetical protein PACTADRAFT_42973 [Pachysolen tannophilus NRRL Y-2460]
MSRRGNDEGHAIRLPGSLLDQIREKEEKGDYGTDKRYDSLNNNKKRKIVKKELSRKDRRKKERQETKLKKKVPLKTNHKSGGSIEFGKVSRKDISDDEEISDNNVTDTWEALKAAKSKKQQEINEEEEEEVSELEAEFDGFSDEEDIEDEVNHTSVEETMAALQALKNKKNKIPIQQKQVNKVNSKKGSKNHAQVDQMTKELLKKDEEEIDYFAKKLGLKKGQKLNKENDELDYLLEGLDSDLDHNSIESDDEEKQGKVELPWSSDDEISDFDEIGEDEEESDSYLNSDNENSSNEPKQKPNPYIPANSNNNGSGKAVEAKEKYVPPYLRKQLELQNSQESQEVLNLKLQIRGPLNRLTEANMQSTVSIINQLYDSNPRKIVNEVLVELILLNVLHQDKRTDVFILSYACLINSVYRLQGVEFGAYFIQELIMKLQDFENNPDKMKNKELVNLISILGYCYIFGLISCKILYDVIKQKLISSSTDITELKIEMLLQLIKISGSQMRSDDPSSLKDIILNLTRKINDQEKEKGEKSNSRTRYLINVISDLRNNKLKSGNDINGNTSQMIIRMKKFLGSINHNKFHDPIQVSLDDIENIEQKGKWWLVGSSWKGNTVNENTGDVIKDSVVEVNEDVMNDILDSAEPNWLELAKAQRMNTDIRRAIFISIMSASDFADAFEKLNKLQLKRQQEREIPKILTHCVSIEKTYNPYYAFLAKKLCGSHSMRKTFQFNLWDLIKELEGNEDNEGHEHDLLLKLDRGAKEDNEELTLQKILNLGRLYGVLIAEGSLPLNILRVVDFLTSSADTIIFVEILLVTFLNQVAKKSEISAFGAGKSNANKKGDLEDLRFEDNLIIEKIASCKEEPLLLKSLQYFLQDKIKLSDFIKNKRERKRIEWACDSICEVIDEFLKA